MIPASNSPSVRELIAEFASLEDRMRSVEARVHGTIGQPLSPELMQLVDRERQILAMLRRHGAPE